MPVAVVLLAAVLFGTTGTAQALSPSGTSPLAVGATRLVVGGAGLVALLPLVGGRWSDVGRLWRTRAGLMAGACTAAYQVCFFAAVSQTGVAVGTLVTIGSGPVLAGLLALLLLGERPTRAWGLSTGLCLLGLAVLVAGGGTSALVDSLGVLLALLAGLGYAGYTVTAKQQLNAGEEPSTVMASAFGLGGVLLLPVLLTQPLGWLAAAPGIALALYLGLLTTTAAYLLFVRGLARLPAGPVTTLMLAEPVIATGLGVLVLGERLGVVSTLGVGMLLAGLVLQGAALSARSAARPQRGPSVSPSPSSSTSSPARSSVS